MNLAQRQIRRLVQVDVNAGETILRASKTIQPGEIFHYILGKSVTKSDPGSIRVNGRYISDPTFRLCRRGLKKFNSKISEKTGQVIADRLIVKGQELILQQQEY